MRSSRPLWNASAQNEGDYCMPIVADSRQKSVTITTFLERSRKENRNDHAIHMSVHPENLVKIGLVHSQINGLQGFVKEDKNEGK